MRTKQLLTSNLRLLGCVVMSSLILTACGGGGGNSAGSTVTNEPPVIRPLSTPVSVAENQTAVTSVSTYNPGGGSLTYSLTGTDASSLSISTSGVITFNTAPDYETKTSYSIVVNVSDGSLSATPQTLAINITDVGDIWVQRGTDIDGEAAGDYAEVVSLSSDGTIVAIGAFSNDDNGDNSGHVRIYAWNGTAWVQRGTDIDGEAAGDRSGLQLSLSSDGTIIAIGADNNDGNGDDSGHVRIYAWNGTAWVQRGTDIDGEAAGDRAGRTVSLSSDGTIVAIGSDRHSNGGLRDGHVRVFTWNGTAWAQTGADIDAQAAGEKAGYFLSLSGDGKVVAVGGGFGFFNHIYTWNGTAWIQTGENIYETDQEGTDLFVDYQFSVSLSSDGTIVAIGSWQNDGNGDNAGHVRVYTWNGTAWLQTGIDIDGEAAGDGSGTPSLNSDGTVLAIGAPANDGNGDNAGHVRIYDWT